jgi:hypothetical protein
MIFNYRYPQLQHLANEQLALPQNILITNMYCCGGHGLYIGGVGGYKDNIVSNIKISNSQVVNSQNGMLRTYFLFCFPSPDLDFECKR